MGWEGWLCRRVSCRIGGGKVRHGEVSVRALVALMPFPSYGWVGSAPAKTSLGRLAATQCPKGGSGGEALTQGPCTTPAFGVGEGTLVAFLGCKREITSAAGRCTQRSFGSRPNPPSLSPLASYCFASYCFVLPEVGGI